MVSTENFCCSPRYSSLRLSHNRFIMHSVSSFQIGEKTFSSPLFPSIRHPGFTGVDIGLNHHGGEASRGEASRTLINPPPRGLGGYRGRPAAGKAWGYGDFQMGPTLF